MDSSQAFGLAHLWAQSDNIIRAVALILLVMSITSWYLILSRSLRQLRARSHSGAVEAFWAAPDLDAGLRVLAERAPESPFEALAQQGAAAAQHVRRHTHSNTLGGKLDTDEVITRALRKSIALSTAALESGLTVLASIGSTAPFVGLFGTVWGIYHALVNISVSGMATLDKVAGPVGEALIMTAFGLFVAIPAVLAYNGITRANRVELSELDAFAHDLHAWFATGARIAAVPGAAPRAAEVATGTPAGAHGAA
ncbi:MAG TPA: MotA/TolQ/ExbB proton channel family protein [Thauera aminoaromatica]|jgi:biopolymer transport protein ExbB|uniref:Biopolymer transport protein ExbB n=1 Tax=Thauera aminoaromatica TaxID=164330 RepID=C4KDE7_THASP|nr:MULTISPECIES: MotA/TolQ/ExbB proton channel family protein [Thauera]ACR02113.1 MotA/TolQ/ExbB proton channel [Thauera aminoaromatica]KIN90971.1 motA/TolQ/ExbB proton channel family protein [Thauera sp. SWB20]MBP6132483.1 MotA/TolQ/ExbB proton channel family protein [Thauera sp.]MBP7048288.1 MotA/TolQ/ExbB proton channel family protein [Thauera sp.]HNB04488.1 MotA/TolQ/ExbB proton channel family protein [Thauera aminoaromatica]